MQRHVGFVLEPNLGVPIEFFKAPGRVSGTASAAAHQQQLLCLGRRLPWCPRLYSGLRRRWYRLGRLASVRP